MNRKLSGALLAAALVAVAGCGKSPPPPPAGGGGGGNAPKPAAGGDAPAGGKYDAAKSTASVKFTVKWAGAKPPEDITIKPTGDQFCVAAHASGFPNDRFVVNADGTLPNAFVVASDGPHKGLTDFPAPAPFMLEQKGCQYIPHVFGVRVGQNFVIKNSDGTTHNVKGNPKVNPGFNKSQAAGAQDEFSFGKKENAISIGCDVHSWMSAKCFAVEHPFFGTTGADGTVTIKGLPAGKYKFTVWHENMVTTPDAVTASVEVEVKDGATAEQAVDLK